MSDERLGLSSASSFYADVSCAGRQNLIRAMRDQGMVEVREDAAMNELAARGTRIHAARSSGNTFQLKDEGELAAYMGWCKLEREAIEQWQTDKGIKLLSDPILEERLWLNNPSTLAPLLSGMLDVAYIQGVFAAIVDGKTGSAIYADAAEKNWQLRVYSLLLWKEYPQLKNIRVILVKPEATGKQIDYADFSEFDLQQIEQATLHAIWKSQQPDAKRAAGSWCVFCPARSVCEEAVRYAMLPQVTRRDTLKETLSLIETLPIDDVAAAWGKKNEITKIIAALEARLKSLPVEELDRLGLKLTEGRKSDFIKDKIGAFNALRESGFSSEQIFTTLEFSKTAIVKMIQDSRNCRDAEAETIFQVGLDDFIERGRGNPSLVSK